MANDYVPGKEKAEGFACRSSQRTQCGSAQRPLVSIKMVTPSGEL